MKGIRAFALAGVSVLSLSVPAFAQDDKATRKEDQRIQDIIVTGTLIRGQAPTGTQLLQVSNEDIAKLGVVSTSQILGSLAQDNNFNSRPQVGGFGAFQTVNRPTLRYLGGTSAGGSSTLLLLDGERLPGMGIYQTSADIDAIAPGAIERVEVVTDGGSATYGSDAVGGVINLITHKRFDGFQVGGHFGGADNYAQWDANATAGKTWDRGSVWISYNYTHHDSLLYGDRSYARDIDYINNVPTDTRCTPGNVKQAISATRQLIFPIVNGVPSAVPGIGNRCDTYLGRTYFPSESRHNIMAGLNVDLSDNITFDVRAYYMNRQSGAPGGALYYSLPSLTVPGRSTDGDLTNSLGATTFAKTSLSTWGISPKITAKLGHDWRLVAYFNYGEGLAKTAAPGLNGQPDTVPLIVAAATGAFNPNTGTFANTAAGQAAQAYQASYSSLAAGRNEMTNARAVLDGPLFSLPGGDVRAAVGAEIMHEWYALRTGAGSPAFIGTLLQNSSSRTVKSLFGELSVPIFGEGNRMGGFHALTLSASGRYDHYSDFGDTFNPKFGVSWQPFEGWTIRGNWGTAFRAPSLAENVTANVATLNILPASVFPNPAVPATGTTLLLYPGGGSNLQPEKADTWQIGTDFQPTFLRGFSAGMTYYNIDFRGRISNAPFFNPSLFFTQFKNNYTMAPTAAQIAAFAALSATPSAAAPYVADPSLVYALMDARSQNLGRLKTDGLDFHANMDYGTSFGSIFAGVSGTYVLTYKVQAYLGAPFSNLEANQVPRVRMSTTGGVKFGPVLAQATWQHTDGFAVTPSAANLQQSRVGAFNVVNLAFQYKPGGEGVWKDLAITVNIDNVFDTDPPHYNGILGQAPGIAGFTLGRFGQIGINKKF
ncbi:MAG TPA: TonB-dependent receptor [Sphingobium sp.]|uniref:TonB-dependent receptor plug domain-containing protein n=1 Tax=Sphingobium sp. TaxID=1912891 RepID=UPI002ED52A0A